MTATSRPADPVDRRAAMAEAATTIVARDGLRRLTHRAVDRELGLPPGSSSYYLRTRRDLVEAIVRRLAERTLADVVPPQAPVAVRTVTVGKIDVRTVEVRTVDEASLALAGLLDRLAQRPDDHLVRWALAVDLTHDPELHAFLTNHSPLRVQLLDRAAQLLAAIGVVGPDAQAPGLIALVDGLLFDRLAGSGRASSADPATDAEAVLRAYLSGLPRASAEPLREPPPPDP